MRVVTEPLRTKMTSGCLFFGLSDCIGETASHRFLIARVDFMRFAEIGCLGKKSSWSFNNKPGLRLLKPRVSLRLDEWIFGIACLPKKTGQCNDKERQAATGGNPQMIASQIRATFSSQHLALRWWPAGEGCTPSAAQYSGGAVLTASSNTDWNGTSTEPNSRESSATTPRRWSISSPQSPPTTPQRRTKGSHRTNFTAGRAVRTSDRNSR